MCYTAEDSEKHGHVWGDTYGRDGRTDRRMGDCYTQLSLVAQGSSKVANRPRRIPRLFVAPTMLLPIALYFNLNSTSFQVSVRSNDKERLFESTLNIFAK